jgi:hypothetical protein
MASRYTKLSSVECSRHPSSAYNMGFAVRATSYRVTSGYRDYRVVRAHGHFYDEDGELFLTCRGLLYRGCGGADERPQRKAGGTLRIAEASAGTIHCFSGCDQQFWFDGANERIDTEGVWRRDAFFNSCGLAAIEALETTLWRLDGVAHVEWGVRPTDVFEPLDATDLNAYEQSLEPEHPGRDEAPLCGGVPITCGNYYKFQSV